MLIQTHGGYEVTLPDILPISNPLDAAGPLDDGFAQVFADGLSILSRDPGVSVLGFETDFRDGFIYNEEIFASAANLGELTDKPVLFYSSFADVSNPGIADQFMDRGIPVIGGLRKTLAAVKCALSWRDLRQHRLLEAKNPPSGLPDSNAIDAARRQLAGGRSLDENATLQLLSNSGIRVARFERHHTLEGTIQAATRIGYPVVLKTAERGQLHKTETGGVKLNLIDEAQLIHAYEDLSTRLGTQVIIAEMADSGVELALGCVNDADYGPVVSVSAGGALIELLDDRVFALAPFGVTTARRMLEGLKLASMLQGYRDGVATSTTQLAQALSNFSVCVHPSNRTLVRSMSIPLSRDLREAWRLTG